MPDNHVPITTEVLYVSSAPSAAQFDAIQQATRPGAQTTTYGMAQASFKFHTLLRRGLLADPGLRLHCLVGRMVTSRFHRAGWWPGVTEPAGPRSSIHHLGFPNHRGLKQAWLAVAFAWGALKWRVRTRRAPHRVLIADAAYLSALPLVLAVLGGGGISRIAIFADLYSFMAPVEDAGRRSTGILRRLIRRVAAQVYARFDGYVLLTEHMNGVVNPARKPHLVMEGVVDSSARELVNSIEGKSAQPRFLYAGALRREYGVADLVEGFRGLPETGAELHIYGAGDYAAELRQVAREDPRITFHGEAPLDEVIAAELRAWVLVNPRPASAEFTRYSFPSKNMEYLASGTTVLTTRLPGMPADYYPHVRTIDADGPRALREAMRAAIETPLPDLHEFGLAARSWAQTHKNDVVQAGRIMAFARGIGDV